jgi:hypothetical protein
MTKTSPTGLSRQQGLSALCAQACLVLAIAIPALVAGFWALGSWEVLALVRLLPPDILHDMRPEVALGQRVIGAAICLIPALILSYGLLRARRSLMSFARGEFFAAEVVTGLRDYAKATFWAALAGILSVPVLSVVISQPNGAGHRELSLDLSGAPIVNLLGGGILWVLASAMARAAQIAHENEQFV